MHFLPSQSARVLTPQVNLILSRILCMSSMSKKNRFEEESTRQSKRARNLNLQSEPLRKQVCTRRRVESYYRMLRTLAVSEPS
jgi:hypothetical protein